MVARAQLDWLHSPQLKYEVEPSSYEHGALMVRTAGGPCAGAHDARWCALADTYLTVARSSGSKTWPNARQMCRAHTLEKW